MIDRVVIVGAGVFGASLAWWLAREGVQVHLIDQYEPGDPRATSGGETRLFRCSHGDDRLYSAMARRARELWPEVGPGLYEETGMAWFARSEDGWEAHSETVLRELGIPCERVELPGVNGEDLAFTLFEPEAGVLRAAAATAALAAGAVEHGATFERRRVPAGERFDALTVWACGIWLGPLFGLPIRCTRQCLFFYDADFGELPAWVDYDGAMYGTPDVDDLGIKMAPDGEGPLLDPEAEVPVPRAGQRGERDARAYLAHRVPGCAGAPLKGAVGCRYELSPDSHFMVGEVEPGVWVLGGGSGHGFKHGPALAERVARCLDGTEAPPDVWRLGNRAPGRSLRTAGSNSGRWSG